jgi:hypothetical protein
MMSIHHPRSRSFQVRQVLEGVEDAVPVAAGVGRRAHAVDWQRKFATRLGNIKAVLARINVDVEVPRRSNSLKSGRNQSWCCGRSRRVSWVYSFVASPEKCAEKQKCRSPDQSGAAS